MNNEVPGASVPGEILERMRNTKSKGEAFSEGVLIAKETYQHVRTEVNGIQISAPLGRIDAVMMVLED
jgi:homocysteine S-methyltransferase